MPAYLITRAAEVAAKIPAARRGRFFEALALAIQREADPGTRRALQQLGARAVYHGVRFRGAPLRCPVQFTWTDDGK